MKRCYMLLAVLVFLCTVCLNALAEATMGDENLAEVDVAVASMPAVPEMQAKAAILMDRATGRVLYEMNADQVLPVASTTKIMTALIALESCELNEIVTAGPNASGMTGTSIYLGVGEQLSMREMLYGLLLRSGNDAAVAIAEHIAGDVGGFVGIMNERAEQLGADANFENPHGLDEEGHGASARAMALIACEAMGNPTFREMVSTREVIIPWVDNQYSRVLQNKNQLLDEFDGATGIKTGFTDAAGRCLVFSAMRDGVEYIGVLLNCGDWFGTAEQLLTWGFDAYDPVQAASQGAMLAEVGVRGGDARTVGAVAKESLVVPIGMDEEWRIEMELPESLTAPVQAGQLLGHLRVLVNDHSVAQAEIVASVPVNSWNFGAALHKIARLWSLAPA